jgi:hypothetical protein
LIPDRLPIARSLLLVLQGAAAGCADPPRHEDFAIGLDRRTLRTRFGEPVRSPAF